MTSRKIIIGTRGSKLALIQAELAANALRAVDSSIEVEMKIITPKGDRDKTSPIPLDTIGKGWFSQEIESELQDGTIDLAVHSLKDLLTDLPKGLTIGAYLKREDARDALITKKGQPFDKLRVGAVIGTDSTRRQAQMRVMRPDSVMKSLRGNVPNRVQKLQDEDYDAIILAAAGLIRLGMQDAITRYFEPEEMTPAPGQGIIAVEAKATNTALLELLAKANDTDASDAAYIERSFSEIIGGGCKAPTGAYAYKEGTFWTVLGMAQKDDGSIVREKMSAQEDKKTMLGKLLAEKILVQLHG